MSFASGAFAYTYLSGAEPGLVMMGRVPSMLARFDIVMMEEHSSRSGTLVASVSVIVLIASGKLEDCDMYFRTNLAGKTRRGAASPAEM